MTKAALSFQPFMRELTDRQLNDLADLPWYPRDAVQNARMMNGVLVADRHALVIGAKLMASDYSPQQIAAIRQDLINLGINNTLHKDGVTLEIPGNPEHDRVSVPAFIQMILPRMKVFRDVTAYEAAFGQGASLKADVTAALNGMKTNPLQDDERMRAVWLPLIERITGLSNEDLPRSAGDMVVTMKGIFEYLDGLRKDLACSLSRPDHDEAKAPVLKV